MYVCIYICIYIYIYIKFESHLMMCCIKQKCFKNTYFLKYFAFFTEALSV